MSSTSTKKTQNNFQHQEKTVPYAVIETDLLEDENLSNAEFRTLAILLSYASKQGFCNITNKTLEAKYSFLKERNFRKICKQLEDKHYISRIHHPLHKRGSMRYLVPAQHHDKFIKYVLKKHHAFKYAAQIKTFFEGGEEKAWENAYRLQYSSHKIVKYNAPKKQISISSTGTLCAAPADRNVKCRSINNINIIKEEKDSVRGKTPPLFKEVEKQKISRELIEKELSKLNLDWEKGWTLYECCKKEIDAYKNPIAGLVAAIKGGYADEKINKAEEKLAKEKAAIDERETKAKRRQMAHQAAQAIQRSLKQRNLEGKIYDMYVDDTHATIKVLDTKRAYYFDYGKPETIDRLFYFAHRTDIEINLKEKKNE